MNGQLNSNIYNASSNGADIEELQKQIDSLNTSVGSISEKLDETTEALNEYKAENSNQISTAEIISTSATVDNLSSNTINGTTLCINGTSNQKDINAEDIFATGNIHANNLYGSLIGGNISGSTLEVESGAVSGSLTAKTITAENVNVANSLEANTITSNSITNTGDATITGCLKAKGLELTNGASLTGNAVDVCNVLARNSICTMGNGSIDGNLEVKGNITGDVNGDITSTNANITNGTIDNLTVNGTLTVANGITLPNTLGDTTLTSVTTDKLTVNGDTELNGAVKAGSITIGDGSITAGEVCIGAKGIVIDKDKNAAFADISSSNITAENIEVNTKINASCVESKDVVTDNTFTKNLYPENITIDKDVGDLHYSRQLDTDAVGGVLVDCKTVTPKEGATGIITKYKDSESNTINPDSIEYVNEKNGIKVVSCSTTDTTTNEIDLDTVTNVYSIKADETGFGIYAGDKKAFGVGADGKANLCICKCTGEDPLSGNVVKLDESGNLYTGRADGLSDGIIVDGVCTNTLTNTAAQIDSKIKNNDNYYNCLTRTVGSTENKIYSCRYNSSCRENCYYDVKANIDCVTATFYDCITMTGGTSTKQETYEVHPRMVCHNVKVDDKYDNLLICHSPQSATFLSRYSDMHDEYSWQVYICDSNISITNPSRTTTGEQEVILKVEDGKIYTKCGEFIAGSGSGGYFEDATFSNDCISGTRSIVDDTITTKLATLTTNQYSFETSTPNNVMIGIGKCNCNCGLYIGSCDNLNCTVYFCYYNDNCTDGTYDRYSYNLLTGYMCRECYDGRSSDGYCGTKENYCCCCVCRTNNSRRTYCCVMTPNMQCCHNDTYCWNDTTSYCTCCYSNCKNTICDNGNKYYLEERYNRNSENGSTTSLDYCKREETCTYCIPSVFLSQVQCAQTSSVKKCIGQYCYSSDLFKYRYFSEKGDLYGYEEEDAGSFEDVYYYCPTYYGCKSIYCRYFDGDCFCGCKYNTSTCQYECFATSSCVNISDSSIYKYLCINNSCVSLKEKVVNNQITNLPITNTLVPLAGKVNGNGFAFFCKGSDGTKFYDSSFAVVDAGAATDVTYLVTTGV